MTLPKHLAVSDILDLISFLYYDLSNVSSVTIPETRFAIGRKFDPKSVKLNCIGPCLTINTLRSSINTEVDNSCTILNSNMLVRIQILQLNNILDD